MTIANALWKLLLDPPTLTEKIAAAAGQQLSPAYEEGPGHMYIQAVVRAFNENLPEDETDIYAHVKNRQDERWGVDVDSVMPHQAARHAIALGLLSWPYKVTADTEVTAGQLLVDQLRHYTSALVTVLCEAAIEAHENGPEPAYLAIINVPGYMPWAEEPAEFPTIASAWEYLADERRRQEDQDDSTSDYSELPEKLATLAAAENPEVGSVYGSTPGYDGDHDLGLVYTVTHKQD